MLTLVSFSELLKGSENSITKLDLCVILSVSNYNLMNEINKVRQMCVSCCNSPCLVGSVGLKFLSYIIAFL